MLLQTQQIRHELMALSEEKYAKFTSKLIPHCDNLLGVRIPVLRKMAKQLAKEKSIEYLMSDDEIYFEETMLKGLIIGYTKGEISVILEYVTHFVPKINNWSICDSFCNGLKVVRNHKEIVWQFLQTYYQSEKTYDIRFAVVMMLNHFVEESYLPKLFKVFDEAKKTDYYVQMAVAWAISICFVKFPEETMGYLKNNQLDNETYKKTLQKIGESNRVDGETKKVIKSMGR